MDFIKEMLEVISPKPNNLTLGSLKKIVGQFKNEQELYDLVNKGDLTSLREAINNITRGGPNSKTTQLYEGYFKQFIDFISTKQPTSSTQSTTEPSFNTSDQTLINRTQSYKELKPEVLS